VKILLIMFIVVLLFGGSRLPNVARGLGSGIRNFKDSLKGDDQDSNGPQPR
jgi:sec-independent protein translocase protein TatA